MSVCALPIPGAARHVTKTSVSDLCTVPLDAPHRLLAVWCFVNYLDRGGFPLPRQERGTFNGVPWVHWVMGLWTLPSTNSCLSSWT